MTNDERAYFTQAESWANDTRIIAARSRRTAWIIAGVAVAVAAFEAVALAMLAPLKTIQPIALLVDKQTGYVQALDPLTPRRVGADEALTTSLLAQYVTAREQFDRATVAADYRRVALWSAGHTRDVYLAQMPATNPASPFQRYPAGRTVEARVKSVSRLGQGVALVRFDTQLADRNGRVDPAQPWLSVIRFHYVDAPMRFEDRLVNPLGFQVVGYRRDAEAPPPPTPVQASVAAVSAAPTSVVTSTTFVRTPNIIVRQAAPTTTPPYSQSRAAAPQRPTGSTAPHTGAIERREVPLNNLPMGSPMSPSNTPIGMAAAGVQR